MFDFETIWWSHKTNNLIKLFAILNKGKHEAEWNEVECVVNIFCIFIVSRKNWQGSSVLSFIDSH